MSALPTDDRWLDEALPGLVRRFSAGSADPAGQLARPGGRAMPGRKAVVETLERQIGRAHV
jgi:hypothetical protein